MTKLRAVLHRRWPVLLAGVLLGALAGALSAALAPSGDAEVAYSVSQLIVANRSAAQQGSVEQDALRVTRGTVAEKAAAALGATDTASVASRVAAVANTESLSIEVSTTDPDPDVATERAGAFVAAFLDVVNADLLVDQERRFAEIQQQIDAAQADLDAFDAANPDLSPLSAGGNLEAYDLLVAQRASLDDVVRSAQEQLQTERLNAKSVLPYSTLGPDAPSTVDSDLLPVPTGMPFRVALLGMFGFALSVGLIMVLERLSPRIDTRDELVATVELPVLAEVGYFPNRKWPIASDGTLRLDGAWAEPYRRIRSAIQFVQASSEGDPPRVFLFTSPSPSEGKSTTTAVTGLALAEAGEQTLIVGGDFRRPSVHKLLGIQATPGIREHARLDIDRPTSQQIVHPTNHHDLYVAPSGASGKEVVGLADAACELVAEAVEQGATVLIDTSPVEVANDAIDLLPVVDEVIVIVRSGKTARKTLLHTIEQLKMHGATIMGMALIGTPGLAKQQYYYEGYYADSTAAGGGDSPLFPPEAGPDATVESAESTASDVGAPPRAVEPMAARNGIPSPSSAAPATEMEHLPPPPSAAPGWTPPPSPQT